MTMQLRGRTIDDWGIAAFTESGLCDLIMRGVDIAGLPVHGGASIEQFNALCKEWDHPQDCVSVYVPPSESVQEWDAARQSEWFTPEPYASMNVLEWLLERCNTEAEQMRIAEEWILFEERGMEPVLRFLIYMIAYFRDNNILWGVGRGSSVSSYALYLIGVHKVNSMAFDLDPREFLK